MDGQERPDLGHSGIDGTVSAGRSDEVGRCTGTGHLCTAGMAAMPTSTMIDELTLAGHLQVSTRTIRRMVAHGQIPEGVKIGGRRVWMVGKLLEYVAAEADRLASEARRRALRLTSGRI